MICRGLRQHTDVYASPPARCVLKILSKESGGTSRQLVNAHEPELACLSRRGRARSSFLFQCLAHTDDRAGGVRIRENQRVGLEMENSQLGGPTHSTKTEEA